MTNLPAAPLREQSGAAGQDTGSVVPLNAAPMPTDPAQILAQNQPQNNGKTNRFRLFLWIGGGLFAAQMFMPTPMKPTVIAGQTVAGFYGEIMAASAEKEEKLARKRVLAERLADLEARWSEARAKCFMAGLMGPEAAELCYAAVDQNFVPAINQIRRRLALS